jgi:UDP-glucose 4-epimerase
MKRILITGASGFIGSFIVEAALDRGLDVWAGIRSTSSKRYLTDERINFLELNFADRELLRSQIEGHRDKYGAFDYVVHCAGATKCRDKSDFNRVNNRQTCELVDALISLEMVPERFIFVSTLSVFGPIHEDNYAPIKESDTPRPNTAYGVSKLTAERYISSIADFPYVFLRPTGVYGPREADYFLMAKSIASHVDFSVGYKRQDLTFVYVKDVAQAVFAVIDSGVRRRAYFLSDGGVYPSRAFSDLIQSELGVSCVLRIKSPLCVLKAVSFVAEKLATLAGKSSTLNMDKYKIMKQRNWRCDITPAVEEIGYKPEYDLARGVAETISWYKREGWL